MSSSPQPVEQYTFTRRQALAAAAAAALSIGLSPALATAADAPAAAPLEPHTRPADKRFLVAVDDLFLLQRQNVKAFPLAQKCGCDGIGVDMGSMKGGAELANALRKPETQKEFLDASQKTGVSIAALAFYGQYAHPFAEQTLSDSMIDEWIDTLVAMGVKLGHLPIMGDKRNELANKENAEARTKSIAILKNHAAKAEKAGVILGIESNFDGDGYKRFLDEIGSPAYRAFYNPGTSLEAKYDAYKDMKDLGKDRVCALHLEQGLVAPETFEHLYGDGLIDFPKLKATLLEMDWRGWMFMARSRKQGREKKPTENYTTNAKYLHDLFTE